MPSDTTSTMRVDTPGSKNSSTILNALIGAIAGVVLSFVPLSTVLGGAIAGYLEGGDPGDGVRVGAIAGAIMLVPFVFIGLVFVLFFVGFGTGGAPSVFGVFLFLILLLGAVYTVGLSAVGGYLGIYFKNELE